MRGRIAILTLAVGLVAAGCSGDDTVTSSLAPASAGFPVEVRGVEIPSSPTRIVSLSATHTEILYEIGAGESIIATDFFSDHPAAALGTEKIDAFNLNVEAVAALAPDLVLLSFDPGEAVAGLEALGIPAVLFPVPGPATLDDVYDEIADVGAASGRSEEAGRLIERMSGEFDSILGDVPQMVRAFTFFLELDSTLFTAGEGTLLDSLFAMVGLVNVADPGQGPFQQLSAEYLIATDPDFIFLADTVCCGESAETVSARPGWSVMSAVVNGNVIGLDDGLVSRWGPRLVELLRTIVDEVYGT